MFWFPIEINEHLLENVFHWPMNFFVWKLIDSLKAEM